MPDIFLPVMMTVKYVTDDGRKSCFRPNVLEQQIIKLKRPSFDAFFSELICENKDHCNFENVVEVNVSPNQYFRIEKTCCFDFELKIKNAAIGLFRLQE